jgi:hypothetical protein
MAVIALASAKALPDRVVDLRLELHLLDQSVEHGTVHSLGIAAAHLVPIIVGQLHLGGGRHLDLGHRRQIVEPGFAGGFLGEEIAELIDACLLGEPGEERIILAGAGRLQFLEPGDEAVHVLRRLGGAGRSLGAQFLQKRALRAGACAALRRGRASNRTSGRPARAACGSNAPAIFGTRRSGIGRSRSAAPNGIGSPSSTLV